MKKLLSITLILSLLLSLAACGEKKKDVSTDEPSSFSDSSSDEMINDSESSDSTPQDGSPDEDDSLTETTPDTPSESPSQKPQQSETVVPESKPETPSVQTVASALLSDFKSQVSKNPDAKAETIANALLSNPVIAFSGMATPVEEGYLSGFDNTEIKGFSEGVMFAPMIGSIAFVGYVFTTSDSASAQALASTLKSSANMRWNICVEAEEMICETVGNKVFFVMSPKTFEE